MQFRHWLGSQPVVTENLFRWLQKLRDLGGNRPIPPKAGREVSRLGRMLELPAVPDVRAAVEHLVDVLHPQVGRGGPLKFADVKPICDALRRRSKVVGRGEIDYSDVGIQRAGTPVKLVRFVHHLWGKLHHRAHLEGAVGYDAAPEENDAFWLNANNAAYPDDPWPPVKRPDPAEPTEPGEPDAGATPASAPGAAATPETPPPLPKIDVKPRPLPRPTPGYRPRKNDKLNMYLPPELRPDGSPGGPALPLSPPSEPPVPKATTPSALPKPEGKPEDKPNEGLPKDGALGPVATVLGRLPLEEIQGMKWPQLRDKADAIHRALAAGGHRVAPATDEEIDAVYTKLQMPDPGVSGPGPAARGGDTEQMPAPG